MSNEISDKTCIMIVDDDLSMLQTIAVMLEEEGYDVLTCGAGKEAIDKFHDAVFAVVLDINMPDISGLEVFEIIKSKNQYVPIVFHTGYDEKRKKNRHPQAFSAPCLCGKGQRPGTTPRHGRRRSRIV